MGVNRKYSFTYMGQEVKAGSKMIFTGEYFDKNGKRYYKGMWPCTFKYVEDNKFYIEVDGNIYYHKKLNNNSIWRFTVLNGEKIPNPATEDDITVARIILILVIVGTSIFKCNIVLWVIEFIIYANYVKRKKYS